MTSKGSDDRDIRVCYVTGSYPPEYSGAGKSVQDLAAYRVRRGRGAMILTFPNPDLELPSSEAGSPFPVIRIERRRGGGKIGFRAIWKGGTRLVRSRRSFDVIHSFGAGGLTFLIPVLGRLIRRPTLFTMTLLDSSDLRAIRSQRWGRVKSWLFRRHGAVTGKSRVMVERSIESGMPPDKITYIPNAVPHHPGDGKGGFDRKRVRRGIGVPPDAKLCCFLGNLSRRKGVDILVDAWRRLAGEGLYLLLIGPGSREESPRIDEAFVREMKRKIREDSLEKWIRPVGYVRPPGEVFRLLRASDVFLFPSRREGFPQSLLLALEAGLPAISSPFPGHEDFLELAGEPVCRFLPRGFVPEDLVREVRELISSPGLRKGLGEAGRRFVRRHYSQEVVFEKYETVYRNLLEG